MTGCRLGARLGSSSPATVRLQKRLPKGSLSNPVLLKLSVAATATVSLAEMTSRPTKPVGFEQLLMLFTRPTDSRQTVASTRPSISPVGQPHISRSRRPILELLRKVGCRLSSGRRLGDLLFGVPRLLHRFSFLP